MPPSQTTNASEVVNVAKITIVEIRLCRGGVLRRHTPIPMFRFLVLDAMSWNMHVISCIQPRSQLGRGKR